MPTNDDIAHQQHLLDTHRQTLQHLLNQRAIHTYAYTPPATLHGIDQTRKEICKLKESLRSWSVEVEDLPIDEEQDNKNLSTTTAQVDTHLTNSSHVAERYQSPLLLGVMVDVSQVMLATIKALPKKSGLSSRSLKEAIESLRNQIVALRKAEQSTEALSNIYLYIYAFGVGRIRHAFYDVFLRDAGLYTGDPVDDSSVRDIFADIAVKEGLPHTPSGEVLDENWELYRKGIDNNLADLISGGPASLYEAMRQTKERIENELQTKRIDNAALLIISSGQAEEGFDHKVVAIANEIKTLGIDIICCYLHKSNILQPYRLYAQPEDSWPSEARLLFECSSHTKSHSSFSKALVKTLSTKSWKMPEGSRFLVQVNQSKILRDVIDSINNSMPQ